MRIVILLLAASLVAGCTHVRRAAQEDPMQCERDPKCEKKRSGMMDCSRQCNDDPACMDRCEQVQQGTPSARLGH